MIIRQSPAIIDSKGGIHYIKFPEIFKNTSVLKKLVIAIDGPAASGKSTTARLVAERLGYLHVDTGAMYRAMTVKVLRSGIAPDDDAAIAELARSTTITVSETRGSQAVLLDGVDVAREIRSPEVTQAVSRVSSLKEVRDLMVREQRRLASGGGVVLEGRDIGTVVLPHADVKIFMVADVNERARRRRRELTENRIDVSLEALIGEIRDRDRRDSSREVSPLRKSDDALEVDTSGLSIEDQVTRILGEVKRKSGGDATTS
jgi:cytidylate kinase